MAPRWAFIVGTRPEIIKTAPVIHELRRSKQAESFVIFTNQHRELAQQAFADFGIQPDLHLEIPRKQSSLSEFLHTAVEQLVQKLPHLDVRGVMVQGDTTTALAGALGALRMCLPLAHLEAGLRSFDLTSPFPEEAHRQLIGQLAAIHFCPTKRAQDNLAAEGVRDNVYLVGNTIVDAVKQCAMPLRQPTSGKVLLVSGHRRENLFGAIDNLCDVLLRLIEDFPELQVVYLCHPNPAAQAPVEKKLRDNTRIQLVAPVSYPDALQLLQQADLLITDSGGFQEEAACFKKRIFVTRSATERPEVIECGLGELLPMMDPERLYQRVREEITQPTRVDPTLKNPFGDGHAAARIVEVLCRFGTSP